MTLDVQLNRPFRNLSDSLVVAQVEIFSGLPPFILLNIFFAIWDTPAYLTDSDGKEDRDTLRDHVAGRPFPEDLFTYNWNGGLFI